MTSQTVWKHLKKHTIFLEVSLDWCTCLNPRLFGPVTGVFVFGTFWNLERRDKRTLEIGNSFDIAERSDRSGEEARSAAYGHYRHVAWKHFNWKHLANLEMSRTCDAFTDLLPKETCIHAHGRKGVIGWFYVQAPGGFGGDVARFVCGDISLCAMKTGRCRA